VRNTHPSWLNRLWPPWRLLFLTDWRLWTLLLLHLQLFNRFDWGYGLLNRLKDVMNHLLLGRWRFRRQRRNHWRVVSFFQLVIAYVCLLLDEMLSRFIYVIESDLLFFSFFSNAFTLMQWSCLLKLYRVLNCVLNILQLLDLLKTVLSLHLDVMWLELFRIVRVIPRMLLWIDEWVHLYLLHLGLYLRRPLIALSRIYSKSMLGLYIARLRLQIGLCCLEQRVILDKIKLCVLLLVLFLCRIELFLLLGRDTSSRFHQRGHIGSLWIRLPTLVQVLGAGWSLGCFLKVTELCVV